MFSYLEGLSPAEAENVKKTIQDLFRQTCILQVKYDPVTYLEGLSPAEAENVKKTIQDLFRQTCILQVKYDPVTLTAKDNARYQVCNADCKGQCPLSGMCKASGIYFRLLCGVGMRLDTRPAGQDIPYRGGGRAR